MGDPTLNVPDPEHQGVNTGGQPGTAPIPNGSGDGQPGAPTYNGPSLLADNDMKAGDYDSNHNADFTYQNFVNAYQDPNQKQNQNAIGAMPGQGLQGYGAGGSSLAGLTTLAPTQNAQAATVDTGQSQNFMGGQVTNMNALNAQAQGLGPSVAAQVAKQQAEANISANAAMLGSQRGSSNSALGLRQAQDQAAGQQQQAAQNAVMGRAQEAMGARQQLTGALSGATQQAQQGAQAQAQLSQQAGMQNANAANTAQLQQGQQDTQTKLANLQAQLQAGQLNTNQYNAYVLALMAQNNNDWGAQMNAYGQMLNENTQLQGMHNAAAINSANNQYGMMGAAISGAAGLGAGVATAISDKRLKTDVTPGARGIKDFLSQIGSAAPSRFALMG